MEKFLFVVEKASICEKWERRYEEWWLTRIVCTDAISKRRENLVHAARRVRRSSGARLVGGVESV